MEPAFQNLESLSPADRALFNQFGRGVSKTRSFTVVHKAFEHFADIIANEPAVYHNGFSVTYGELERQANSLSNYLLQRGLKPKERVCLAFSRSISLLVSIFAVLKAGCQYVPMDGGVVTEESMAHILSDTEAPFVLCLAKFKEKVRRSAGPGQRVVVVDEDWRGQAGSPMNMHRPSIQVDETDGCYIIFTSGTTGKPKGVDVTHGNATNTLTLYPGNLGIRPGSRVAQVLNISFDMAAWEMLGTLMNGGTLVLRTSNWVETLRQVDTLIATPSVVAKYKKEDFTNLKTIAVGGERCPQSLADDWAVGTTFVNICGPTEITILNTAHIHQPGKELSIGKPIPNTNVYILDEDAKPVAIGETGLMWVGGKGVSRGYLNLPQLTSTRYLPDPFRNNGTFMFNTNDLVKWRKDGSVEILGRADDQVKIKGFRVELDGISAVMEKYPGVSKACAILIREEIWGFYESQSQINIPDLQKLLNSELPYYAVPARWLQMETMPLTSNGKVDKRALRDMAGDTSVPATATAAVSAPAPTPAHAPAPPAPAKAPSASANEMMLQTNSVSSLELALSENEFTEKDFVLPTKRGFHGERWLRHRFFTLYRRFFSAVLFANLATATALLTSYWQVNEVSLQSLATAIAANLTAAVLLRQEVVINFLYDVATALPLWMPLAVRRHFARVYHIGGLHSGCAVMSVVWFVAFTAVATYYRSVQDPKYTVDEAPLVLSYIALACLGIMITLAYPSLRIKYHNYFEMTHRFAGWLALALLWIQTVLVTDSLRDRRMQTLGEALKANPAFWLLVIATGSIILPWLRLRKVDVRPEYLSKHAVRLFFNYATPVTGSFVRLSTRPLYEWHAFATVAEPTKRGFSVVVSNAGDWTKGQINSPSGKLWVRGIPTCGVLRICPLFKRFVLVATGSGIGPCLPVIMERRVPFRVYWSTRDPVTTYGQGIVDVVLGGDPHALIHNTTTMGKPDIVAQVYQLYVELDAEAVLVISNKKLTEKIVYAMESRGIPAFGAIFDS